MDPHPDWTASLRTDLTLGRRWQLSALVDTRQGNEVWNGTRGALYQFGTHKDTEIRGTQQVFGSNGFHEGAVAGPGAGTPVTIDQAWFQNLGSGFGPVASQFIEDGSFVGTARVGGAVRVTGRGRIDGSACAVARALRALPSVRAPLLLPGGRVHPV